MKKERSMKTLGAVSCFLCVVAAICLSMPAYSQEGPSLFVVLDFMKVQPSQHSVYLEVEQDIWKPMHQERIHQGIIVGWFLYALEFSSRCTTVLKSWKTPGGRGSPRKSTRT
jgi:hypothetical protein